MSKVWVRYARNVQLFSDDETWWISYNPNTKTLGDMWSGDGGGDETALVGNGVYLILNGDFREDYERLVDCGYEACLKFYESKKALFKSSWSNDV